MILNVINVINQCYKMSAWWHLWFTTRWKVGCSSENRKYAGKSRIYQGRVAHAFRLILVPIFSAATAVSKSKCLLKMFWRWAGTEEVLSVAGHLHTSTSHPSPMHMQIRVGSWEQLYFNFIIMPWCCSRGWGRGRGRQVNTLPAVLQYCSVSPDWWLLQSAAECDTSPHPAVGQF